MTTRLTAESDTFTHYRVKVGPVWFHAVRMGAAMPVLDALRDEDPLWARVSVELMASRPTFDWMGPFPAAGHTKYWLEDESA